MIFNGFIMRFFFVLLLGIVSGASGMNSLEEKHSHFDLERKEFRIVRITWNQETYEELDEKLNEVESRRQYKKYLQLLQLWIKKDLNLKD